MVRTKASNAAPAATRKAVAARAPRKSVGVPRPVGSSPCSSGSGRSKKGKSVVGGNPAKLWGTPEWQKGIGSFLKSDREDGGVQNDDHQQPGPSNEHTREMEEECDEPMMTSVATESGSGGVAVLDSSIAQLNSDEEDED